jgi:hypothetical protein
MFNGIALEKYPWKADGRDLNFRGLDQIESILSRPSFMGAAGEDFLPLSAQFTNPLSSLQLQKLFTTYSEVAQFTEQYRGWTQRASDFGISKTRTSSRITRTKFRMHWEPDQIESGVRSSGEHLQKSSGTGIRNAWKTAEFPLAYRLLLVGKLDGVCSEPLITYAAHS